MSTKLLWTICGCVAVLGLFLILQQNQVFGNRKKVQGVSTVNLPSANFPLELPPNKKETFQEVKVYAKSILLIDIDSFYPMFDKNSDVEVPVASTTKMITALVVLENFPDELKDIVTVKEQNINVEGSKILLRPGEKITVENLLNGLLINSGNDTAYTLADYFGGKEKFVSLMNEKAKQIGARKTSFKDPAGLNDDGRSTAKDLAVIGAYGLKNEKFSEIVRIPEKTVYSTDGRISHELKNSNRMLRSEEPFYYANTIGIKTGFTFAAGHVLVSAAEKNGHKILAVVLNTNEDSTTATAKESKKLLQWGFDNWSWK